MCTGLGKENKKQTSKLYTNYIQNFINSVCIQYGINDFIIYIEKM